MTSTSFEFVCKSVYCPASNYMFKVNNRNSRTRCEICSKLTINIPEWHWRRSGIFIVNFEHFPHFAIVCKCRLGVFCKYIYSAKTKLIRFFVWQRRSQQNEGVNQIQFTNECKSINQKRHPGRVKSYTT